MGLALRIHQRRNFLVNRDRDDPDFKEVNNLKLFYQDA
jgi:hypothetical protein